MEQQALNKVSMCVWIKLHTVAECEHIFGPSEEENVFHWIKPLPSCLSAYTHSFIQEDLTSRASCIHGADTQIQGCNIQADFPFTLYVLYVKMLCIWLYMQKRIPQCDIQTIPVKRL